MPHLDYASGYLYISFCPVKKLKPFARNNLLVQHLRGSPRARQHKKPRGDPSPKRHSIREIVVHTAYGKYTVRRRLLGEKRGAFPQKGSNWFSRFREGTEKAWKHERLYKGRRR